MKRPEELGLGEGLGLGSGGVSNSSSRSKMWTEVLSAKLTRRERFLWKATVSSSVSLLMSPAARFERGVFVDLKETDLFCLDLNFCWRI